MITIFPYSMDIYIKFLTIFFSNFNYYLSQLSRLISWLRLNSLKNTDYLDSWHKLIN